MTRIVTGHAGAEWAPIAALTLPALESYCKRHGYELWDMPLAQYAEGRPSSWGKVPALARALHDADLAVWIDADALVMPGAPAIHAAMPEGSWQALVVHSVAGERVPNCGVWALGLEMRDVLPRLWNRREYIDHPWWEQAALIEEMEYTLSSGGSASLLWMRTKVMDNRWNAHPHDWRDDAYVRHASGVPSLEARQAMLSAWLAAEVVPC